MKLNRLISEQGNIGHETEVGMNVPGGTDPGIIRQKAKEIKPANNRQIWLLALYFAVEKNIDFSKVNIELLRKPGYASFLYDEAGRSEGLLKELSNPLSMQDVSRILGKTYDPKNFLLLWASKFIPDEGKFGRQFMLLYLAHRLNTNKKLNFEDAKKDISIAKRLYNRYGGQDGIIKFLSTPEAISELTRIYDGFADEYLKHAARTISRNG